MRNFVKKVFFLLIVVSSIIFLFACENKNDNLDNAEKSVIIYDVENSIIKDNSVFMLVDATTNSVSLADKVTCSENCIWKLYYDSLGQIEIPTKVASGLSGALLNGDNKFYLLVSSLDGVFTNLYELTIHRSYLVSIDYQYYDDIKQDTISLKEEFIYTGEMLDVAFMPEIEGYSFLYWTIDEKKIQPFVVWQDMVLLAKTKGKRSYVNFDVNGGDEQFNCIEVTYGQEFSLPIPQKIGYTFIGWYYENEEISDSLGVTNPWRFSQNVTLIANWNINFYNVTLYSEILDRTVECEEGAREYFSDWTVGSGNYCYNSKVTISANIIDGYNFLGWYDVFGNCISEEMTYTFILTDNTDFVAIWDFYTVTIITNNILAGTFSINENFDEHQKISIGKLVKLEANTNEGYTWRGWYNENKLVSKELVYIFPMTNQSVSLHAEWMECPIIIQHDNTTKISYFPKTTVVGQQITVTAYPYLGYHFLGWFSNNEQLSTTSTYTFIIPDCVTEKIVYSVKSEQNAELKNFYFTATQTTLKITGVKDVSVTTLIVPDYVTEIEDGIFANCHNLISLSVPFINGAFCELFGRTKYDESRDVVRIRANGQNYGEQFYIPLTLNYVVIKRGNIRVGAFEGCGLTVFLCDSVVVTGSQTRIYYYGDKRQYEYFLCEVESCPINWHDTAQSDTWQYKWGVKWQYVNGIPTEIKESK